MSWHAVKTCLPSVLVKPAKMQMNISRVSVLLIMLFLSLSNSPMQLFENISRRNI